MMGIWVASFGGALHGPVTTYFQAPRTAAAWISKKTPPLFEWSWSHGCVICFDPFSCIICALFGESRVFVIVCCVAECLGHSPFNQCALINLCTR